MQKLISLILSLVMVVSLGVSASAHGTNDSRGDVMSDVSVTQKLFPAEFDAEILRMVKEQFGEYKVQYSKPQISAELGGLAVSTITYISTESETVTRAADREIGAISVHTYTNSGAVVGKVLMRGYFSYNGSQAQALGDDMTFESLAYDERFNAYDTDSSSTNGDPASITVRYRVNFAKRTARNAIRVTCTAKGVAKYYDGSFDI